MRVHWTDTALEKPYRLIYRAKQKQVDMLAVIHGASQLPSGLTPR